MFKQTRVHIVKGLIALNERYVFERRLRSWYNEHLGRPTTILDVGANNGQTIEFFLRIDPECRVYAFEPNRKLFARLSERYAGNTNIHLFALGVSDIVGERTFNENLLDYTSTFEELNMDSAYLQKKSKVLGVEPSQIVTDRYAVKTTTLSAFIPEQVKGTIDVLKIDVEGHEFACLKGLFMGARSFPIRFIQLENHNDDMYQNKTSFQDIDRLLQTNGFVLKAKVAHGFGDLDELIYANATV